MLNHKTLNHRNIYFWALILLVFSLPLSMFGMSFSIFLLLFNWIFEGNLKTKMKILRINKSILIFVGFMLIHLLWLINSTDLTYGLHDIKIKLPLLVLPVIVGTSEPIDRKQLNVIINFFITAVIIGTFISTGVLLGFGSYEITNVREISIFISHIRFGLMIDLAIFLLFYDLYLNQNRQKSYKILYKYLGLSWLIIFLFILKSLTAIVIFFIIGTGLGLVFISRQSNLIMKYLLSIVTIMFFLVIALVLYKYYAKYSYVEKIPRYGLEKYTINGNSYNHNFEDTQLENGHFIWSYLCEKELRSEWNRRSNLDYDLPDLKGQEIRYTIIRYLTSKGLRKDSAGLASISSEEVRRIENGMANYIYAKRTSLYSMFYEILWQFDMFKRGENPSGHSIIQRLEYLKAGFSILKKHFWFGVGTGDVQKAFIQYYEETNSQLAYEWRYRAHNQFLTFFLTFGVFGFLLIIFAFISPIIRERGWKNFYFTIFVIIAFLSMLNEDTLETSAGAMFFACFYSLFLFSIKIKT